MQHITRWPFVQVGFYLALFSVLALALGGHLPDSQAGWITCPPRLPPGAAPDTRRRRRATLAPGDWAARGRACWDYLRHSWRVMVLRSALLAGLWWASGRQGPWAVGLVPLLVTLSRTVQAGWPELATWAPWRLGATALWHGHRLLLGGYLLLALWEAGRASGLPVGLGLGCLHCDREEPWVGVTRQEDGRYRAEFCGHFELTLADRDPFRERLLLLFLRQLEVPGATRGSRRTRDGRTPFVRQMQLQAWFGIVHPVISRLERDWLRGDWPNLLSQRQPAEVLTADLRARIVTTCATFPHQGIAEIYRYLRRQQVAVSAAQVRQAMAESGWSLLRQELQRRFHWTPGEFQWREEFLVQELLRHNQQLLDCLDGGQPVPAAVQVALADLRALAAELGAAPPPPVPARPWLLRVERLLFGRWEEVTDDTVRCPQCRSEDIGRKSRRPRLKKYWDAQQQLQEVAVYRYYCHNPACAVKTFTHLPPGLVPYSRYRLEVHTLALQAYAWGYSVYRRVGPALGVRAVTVYRWVSAWGHNLLPVAALFGLVRCSGVVGVDEKYVLVPKNDKPAGKMRRWMYVYLAVDVYTYDLLHIALYPHNNQGSAHAFLLAFRAKGYHPRVVVTDLRRDYGAVIAQVFARARHHECIFHAEQGIRDYFRETWGRNYAATHPEAVALQETVQEILRARTKRTAQKRYAALCACRRAVVRASPPLEWVFEFLAQHWPTAEMLAQLTALIHSVTDDWLRRLLAGIFLADPVFQARFAEAPAAKLYHHACLGGLLEHSLGVAALVEVVAPRYPQLSRDLLLAVALLHDLGKVEAYAWDTRLALSDAGLLADHLYLGARRVERAIDEIAGFPEELRNRVVHALLAHHGEPAKGSPVRPKTAEAIALHALDELDAHLRGFQDHLDRQSDPDAAWTDKSGMFETALYRGNRETLGSAALAAAAEDVFPDDADDNLPF